MVSVINLVFFNAFLCLLYLSFVVYLYPINELLLLY